MKKIATLAAVCTLIGASRAHAGDAHIHRLYGSGGPASEAVPHLAYYGGPIIHTGTAYAIYWLPPGTFASAGYQPTVNQYLSDVGGTDFYNILAQYTDGAGPTQNVSAFGGAWVDTRPYPHIGTFADPLLDSDIQAEVQHAIESNPLWNPPGPETEYYVFTGRNIYSCFDSSRTGCSYRQYCAYHSAFFNGSTWVIYADIPYLTHGIGCDSGGVPPGDADAQVTISALAHEQFEMVNDPGPATAWYDPTYAEIGDICAYNYLTLNPDNTNLSLHGHGYKIQSMWSNVDNACVLAYVPPPISSLAIKGSSPNQVGTSTHFTVTVVGGTSNTSYHYEFGDGAQLTSTLKSVFHTYPAGGTYTATVSVIASGGTYSASATVHILTNQNFTVGATPASRTARLGASTTFAATSTDVNAFPDPIAFLVGGLPAGATASCSPSPVLPGGSSTCTVNSGTALAGTYALTIIGLSGSINHHADVSLSLVPCTIDGECDDAAFCSGVETCSSGRCAAGTPVNCDDADPCTIDSCAAVVGCSHAGAPVPVEVNDSLRAEETPVDTVLSWTDGLGPFNVYRGTIAAAAPFIYDQACFAQGTLGASASDPSTPDPGAFFYYLVSRVSACGESILGKDSSSAPVPNASPCP